MLYSTAMILIVLWILGLTFGYIMGGLIHILIAVAMIAIFARLIIGDKILKE